MLERGHYLALTVGLLAGVQGSAEATTEAERRANAVIMTAVYVDSCVHTDRILRELCSHFGPQLSGANQSHCQLPALSFEDRTTADYADFRARYRAEFSSAAPRIEQAIQTARHAFDQQFPQALAGRLTGFELESLSRHMNGHCAAVETEWLGADRAGPR